MNKKLFPQDANGIFYMNEIIKYNEKIFTFFSFLEKKIKDKW